MRLLVVEDEKDLNNIIVTRLKNEGYSVDNCFDGEEAWYYIKDIEYDGIILDIMIPHIDGISLLKKLRNENISTPVLFLTAKCNIEDKVAGLDAGANDYLVKPFVFEELLARIRCMTRISSNTNSNILKLEDLTMDCNSKTVTRSNQIIELTGKEYAILEFMLLNKGKILSKEQIERHIWNYDYEGDSDIVKVYIRYLRRKIDDKFTPKLIHTARSFGYVLKSDK